MKMVTPIFIPTPRKSTETVIDGDATSTDGRATGALDEGVCATSLTSLRAFSVAVRDRTAGRGPTTSLRELRPMNYETGTPELLAEVTNSVGILTLNRPDRRNALHFPVIDA